MAVPSKPKDLMVVNGWYLELPTIDSPHFQTLQGMSKSTGTVGIVDAGSNVEYSFPTQIIRNGVITLTRTYQNDINDTAIEAAWDAMMKGAKVPALTAVKMHKGVEVFRLLLEGFRGVSYKHPDWDTDGEEKYLVTYEATVDQWTKL